MVMKLVLTAIRQLKFFLPKNKQSAAPDAFLHDVHVEFVKQAKYLSLLLHWRMTVNGIMT